jgi:uncharacterized protein YkwD
MQYRARASKISPRLLQCFASVATLSSLAVLTACGGGGDSSSSEPTASSADDTTRQVQAATTSTWTRIASEWQSFSVNGVQTVRYGAGSKWVQKSVSGSGSCTNSFFGTDPAVGTSKQCELLTQSSAPAPAPTTAGTCGLPNFNADTLRLVNEFRAAPRNCGSAGNFAAAGPLAWNAKLTQSSLGHSNDMATLNFFSHTSADGRTLADRVNATGYAWSAIAENIAAGYTTVPSVMTAWEGSPGHCANLMNPNLSEIGMACVPGTSGSTYSHYWTMDLGKPR